MTQDQVFVPKTRSQVKLPAFDSTKEDIWGASISNEVMKELYDALGDSPIGALFGAGSYLVCASMTWTQRVSITRSEPAFHLVSRSGLCRAYLINLTLPAFWLAHVSVHERFRSEALPCGHEP